MSLYRQTLRTFPEPAQCFTAIDTLLAAFKAAHKRAASVALCYSLRAAPNPEAAKPHHTNDTHSVTLHADDLAAQMAEVTWFERAAQTL